MYSMGEHMAVHQVQLRMESEEALGSWACPTSEGLSHTEELIGGVALDSAPWRTRYLIVLYLILSCVFALPLNTHYLVFVKWCNRTSRVDEQYKSNAWITVLCPYSLTAWRVAGKPASTEGSAPRYTLQLGQWPKSYPAEM